MAKEIVDLCTKWFAWFFSTMFLILGFFTIKLLSRDHPTITIEDFYVPAFNKTSNSTATTNYTISFDLKFQNENILIGLYYEDSLNLTFSYISPNKRSPVSIPIGEYKIHGFYQGNGMSKHVRDTVETIGFPLVNMAVRELAEIPEDVAGFSVATVANFRVDLTAKLRFKSIENRKAKLVAGANVEVNGNTGKKIKKTSIQLAESGPATASSWEVITVVLSVIGVIGVVLLACYKCWKSNV